jgi:hypothetical protein
VNTTWQQNFNDTIQGTGETDSHLYDNGSLLLAGNVHFYPPFNNPKYDLVRINPDGNIDPTLLVDLFSGGSDIISKIEPYDSNRLMIYGRWGSWLGDNTVEDHLRRIHIPSCTIDTSFNNIIENCPDSNFYSYVQNIKILDSGQILVIGELKIKGLENILGIVRLNSDGSIDSSFNYLNNMNRPFSDFHGTVNAIAELHDGSGYLIGGFFKSYQGHVRNSIAKIDLDGYLDTLALNDLGIDSISQSGIIISDDSHGVRQILPTKDGKFYIAGQINLFNGSYVQPVPLNNTTHLQQREVLVYPNPAKNKVFIENAVHGSIIQIFILEGKMIKNLTCEGACVVKEQGEIIANGKWVKK